MIFKNADRLEAYYFPFNWGVDYKDNTSISEFDFNDNTKNDYYSIIQENVSRFGLFGQGLKMYCTYEGMFNLNGQSIDIEYHVNDKIYYLTSNKSKKDYITYKEKEKWFDYEYQSQEENLLSINFGYKTLLDFEDVQLYFQAIVSIPLHMNEGEEKPVTMEIKSTSNLNLDGKLVIKNRGNIVDETNYPLYKNHSSTVEWIVQ